MTSLAATVLIAASGRGTAFKSLPLTAAPLLRPSWKGQRVWPAGCRLPLLLPPAPPAPPAPRCSPVAHNCPGWLRRRAQEMAGMASVDLTNDEEVVVELQVSRDLQLQPHVETPLLQL